MDNNTVPNAVYDVALKTIRELLAPLPLESVVPPVIKVHWLRRVILELEQRRAVARKGLQAFDDQDDGIVWAAYADGDQVYLTMPQGYAHLAPDSARQLAAKLIEYAQVAESRP
jgi:hypothetical protein